MDPWKSDTPSRDSQVSWWLTSVVPSFILFFRTSCCMQIYAFTIFLLYGNDGFSRTLRDIQGLGNVLISIPSLVFLVVFFCLYGWVCDQKSDLFILNINETFQIQVFLHYNHFKHIHRIWVISFELTVWLLKPTGLTTYDLGDLLRGIVLF